MANDNHKNAEIEQLHRLDNSDCANDDIIKFNSIKIAYNIHQVVNEKLSKENEEYLSELHGWQLAYHSLVSGETSAYNLRAAVFINKSKKVVHFAFAGTNPKNYHDLLDDVYIWRNKTINKLNPMQLLITKVDEAIGAEKTASYSISSSGHSLGGVVSDLLATEMLSRGRKFTTSTTFDNPGSKPIIQEAIQKNLLTYSKEACLDDVAKHCTVFLVKPNFINTTNAQITNDIRLVTPSNTAGRSDIKQKEHEDSKLGWTSFLYDMVGTACNTVADFLGINNLIREINEHKLSNFTDYENHAMKLSEWVESHKKIGYYNPTPIISEEDNPGLASKIKQTQPSTNKDLLFVSEEEGYIKGQWIASTQLEEVQSAQSAKDSNGSSTEDDDTLAGFERVEDLRAEEYSYCSEDNSDHQDDINQETSGQSSEADVNII